MMRTIEAFVWLRWREMLQAFRPGRGRDRLEGASRVLAVLLPLFLTVMLLPTALALGGVALVGGRLMGARGSAHIGDGAAILAVRAVLLLLTAIVVLAPAVRSTFGGERAYARFLLLPIPRRLLHALQVLSGLGDPWLAVFAPAMLLLPLGLLTSGAMLAVAVCAVGSLGLALTLLAATSCSSYACAILFRDRRRGEILTLLIMTALSVSGLVPLLISSNVERRGEDRERGRATRIELPQAVERLPLWTYAIPSELYARSLIAGAEGRPSGFLHAGGLLLWGGGLYALSWRLYRRLLESPEATRSRRRSPRRSYVNAHVPGLSVGASAVAWVTLRSVLRTVRGRMGVFLNFLILGPMLLVFESRFGLSEAIGPLTGVTFAIAGCGFSWMSLAPFLFNQFAVDGAGLTLQWLAPIPTRDIVRGKLAAGAALSGLSTGLCVAVTALVAPRGNFLLWLALLPVFASGFAVLGPIGTLLSAVLPKTADLSRLGKAGNPHDLAVVLGMLTLALALGVPASLGALGVLVFGRPGAALLLAAGWLLLTLALFPALEGLAVAATVKRRENLGLVAAGR